MKKVILASASATRAALLKKAGIKFQIVESGFHERLDPAKTPRALAKYLAYGKARAVAKKYPKALVIGADTLMVLNGRVFGKPKDAQDHRAMLARMSGQRHTMITAVAIVNAGSDSKKVFSCDTHVTFRKLTDAEIKKYIAQGEGRAAAGGYRILRGARKFVENIKGSIDNVAGLPLRETLKAIKVVAAASRKV